MLVFVYIGGVRPPLFAGLSPTPYTGMHSRTVLLAPPFGPSNSDESQQPTIAADVCSRTRSRQTGRAPRGDTTARAPLWPRFPARHRRRGGLTVGERGHPVTAPGLLAGCILEAAAHPGEGGGTDHTLHGRARRPGRSPRVAQPSRSPRGALQRSVHRRPSQPPSPPRRHAVHPVSSCVAARGCTQASRQVRLAGGGGAGPAKERGACQTEAVHHGHPSPSSRRGGTTLAPSEGVVSRETRSSAMPSVSACLFTPIFRATLTHDETRRGTAPSGGLTSSSAAPPGDHRSGPPGRQPFTAGAPRPAISAAASRYATAPAEAGS